MKELKDNEEKHLMK